MDKNIYYKYHALVETIKKKTLIKLVKNMLEYWYYTSLINFKILFVKTKYVPNT